MEIYRERLTPNVGIHLALLLLLPLGFGMLAPINVMAGILAGVGIYAIAELWLTLGAPRILVTDTTFAAGGASISREALGTVTVIEKSERIGALADARAWKLLRAWIPTGVTIDVNDEDDPTPYLYVSTRRPVELATALTKV